MGKKLFFYIILYFILFFVTAESYVSGAPGSTIPAGDRDKNSAAFRNGPVDLNERIRFLEGNCERLLKKAGWNADIVVSEIRAYRMHDRFDEMKVEIDAEEAGNAIVFTVSIYKNGKQSLNTFRLTEDTVRDDNILKETVLSCVTPCAMICEGIGDFRKAYSSVFSFGYSRTSDASKFYPSYTAGNLRFAWQLLYDPSSNLLLRETLLSFGDYVSFSMYFDFYKAVRENFYNMDLLIYGKNRHTGSKDNGTRIMYGFFNGLEYFRPGFSDSVMKWDSPIYEDRPYIQYAIWRPLQGNLILSRSKGGSVYSAEFMIGAGMGVGPSSLFLAGTTEEEEPYISDSFRSIKYRKQNYYFSYTLPARMMLTADRIHGFRFELRYNYYFFCPVIRDDLYDMLHLLRGSIGYYLSADVELSMQYERWIINSMLHDNTMSHCWNKLIIEFRNYY